MICDFDYIDITEEIGARSPGWFRATCSRCDASTTGCEPEIDDWTWEHDAECPAPDTPVPTPAEVGAAHRLVGPTKFYCRGPVGVEYPKCGCGERMHPASHPQHVLDALIAAGYRVEPEPETP